MTERNAEIEESVQHWEQQVEAGTEEELRGQVAELQSRLQIVEDRNAQLQEELDNKDEEHVVELIDQHIRLSKSDMQNSAMIKST